MEEEKKINIEANPTFFKLWDLMCGKREFNPNYKVGEKTDKKYWGDFEIYAKTNKDITMSVWNGKHHPSVEENCEKHICKAGTRVRIWMVSRFGDVGITDNLIDPKGYNARGVDADADLFDYEFIENN